MKKTMLSAALIILISGFAAAQSNTKPASKTQEQKIEKKGTIKITSASTYQAKKEVVDAKKDSVEKPVILSVPVVVADTTVVPAVRKQEPIE
jgi:ABC-type amino acid transport substrate-binding protein